MKDKNLISLFLLSVLYYVVNFDNQRCKNILIRNVYEGKHPIKVSWFGLKPFWAAGQLFRDLLQFDKIWRASG